MNQYPIDALIWPAVAIFLVAVLVTIKFTGNPLLSVVVSLVKSGLFVYYFGFVFDGRYTFLDDWSYLEGGLKLSDYGIGVTSIVYEWDYLLMIGRGSHFVYYLYNAYAIRIFGEAYFAPVALNVILTIGVAHLGAKLALEEFAIGAKFSRYLYVFLMLHPDILSWSNVVNGKDILVLLLHVIVLKAAALYFRGQWVKAVWLAVPALTVLLFLRFYTPLLFSIALAAGVVVGGGRLGKGKAAASVLLLLAALYFALEDGGFVQAVRALVSEARDPIYGFVRFVLTPIPFNTERSYEFLNISAIFNWACIPFLAYGLLRVWAFRTDYAKFFVAYALVFVSLYSVFGELQGPRHRVQLDYMIAVFQFLGLMAALRAWLRPSCQPKKKIHGVRIA